MVLKGGEEFTNSSQILYNRLRINTLASIIFSHSLLFVGRRFLSRSIYKSRINGSEILALQTKNRYYNERI